MSRARTVYRALNRAVLAALAAPAVVACSGSPSGGGGTSCATTDASGVGVQLPPGCSVVKNVSASPQDICGMEFLLAGASSACMSRADPSLEVNLVGSTNLDPAACAALCP